MFPRDYEIIDISQPVSSATACFPGDIPFSKQLTVNYKDSGVINLTAMTASPHVGTHADAPSHIHGDISDIDENIGSVSLTAYVGPCLVVDVAPMKTGAVTADILREHIGDALASDIGIARVLVKTVERIRYEVWENDYAYFSVDAVEYLHSLGTKLVGIDTPSVDHVDSKTLATHHAMQKAGMHWLENLDLTAAESGSYFLVAAPLKLMELEASPLRAILLR